MSVVSAANLMVEDCEFTDTNGTAPMCGVCRGALTPFYTPQQQPSQTTLLLVLSKILGETSSKWRGFFQVDLEPDHVFYQVGQASRHSRRCKSLLHLVLHPHVLAVSVLAGAAVGDAAVGVAGFAGGSHVLHLLPPTTNPRPKRCHVGRLDRVDHLFGP